MRLEFDPAASHRIDGKDRYTRTLAYVFQQDGTHLNAEISRFPTPPEKAYSGKKICVSGTVTSFQEEPQIVVRRPSQITVE